MGKFDDVSVESPPELEFLLDPPSASAAPAGTLGPLGDAPAPSARSCSKVRSKSGGDPPVLGKKRKQMNLESKIYIGELPLKAAVI